MKPGEIYHLEEVDPMHGGKPKGRFVIVVTPTEDIAMDLPLYVVACSSSIRDAQIESGRAVELPWSRQGMARTGFRRRTWAVPSWMLRVRPSQLGRRVGHLPSTKLRQIIENLPPDPAGDMT